MSFIEVILIGLGLSMDAAAVSVCKGLAAGRVKLRHSLIAGGYFGFFQALMPAIGYALGSTFAKYIDRYDHWIAFILLALIGGNLLRESFGKEEEAASASFGLSAMLPLAIATSIDALAVGVSFSLLDMTWLGMLQTVLIIGVVTFAVSAAAVKLGGLFGDRFQKPAERVGGVILRLMAVKILLDGLGFWPF